jgi:hypothetical protein
MFKFQQEFKAKLRRDVNFLYLCIYFKATVHLHVVQFIAPVQNICFALYFIKPLSWCRAPAMLQA